MSQYSFQGSGQGSGTRSSQDGAEPSRLSVTQEIRAILAESGALTGDPASLSDEDDLYAAGLTSHGSVNLMLALEDRFDIEFPERLLRRRTFESIAAIREALSSLRDGAAGE